MALLFVGLWIGFAIGAVLVGMMAGSADNDRVNEAYRRGRQDGADATKRMREAFDRESA